MGKEISPLKQTLTPCHASLLPFPNLKKEIAKGGGSEELGDSGVQQVVLCRKRAKIRRIRVGEGACFSV